MTAGSSSVPKCLLQTLVGQLVVTGTHRQHLGAKVHSTCHDIIPSRYVTQHQTQSIILEGA